MKIKLPKAVIERLNLVYGLCDKLLETDTTRISSREIGEALAIPAHTVRKEINFLGEIGDTGAGYEVSRLRAHLAAELGLDHARRACIVGLGRLGSALLEYDWDKTSDFEVVAGFDASINRLETIRSPISLFPAYEIPEVVRREQIELALLTVPRQAAKPAGKLLAEGGIRGIVNFTSVTLGPLPERTAVRNLNLVNELRVLSSLVHLREIENLEKSN